MASCQRGLVPTKKVCKPEKRKPAYRCVAQAKLVSQLRMAHQTFCAARICCCGVSVLLTDARRVGNGAEQPINGLASLPERG